MSKCTTICCSMCGKDLYRPLSVRELREGESKHIDYYIVSEDGNENEICPKCFGYFWKGRTGMPVIKNNTVWENITLDTNAVLDKLRAEIQNIELSGQVDDHTMFVRTADQVKQMLLEIIDRHREGEKEC